MPVVIVAGGAVPVEDRLDVAREIEHVGLVLARLDAARRTFHRVQQVDVSQVGHSRPRLVTADAGRCFARLDGHETLHPLDRHFVLVQGHEEQRPQGRRLEIGRAIGLDRHGAQDALQRERAADRQRLRTAGEIDGLGQLLQHQQLLDFAPLNARHVAARVDVREHQMPRRPGGREAAGDDRFPPAGTQRPRFVTLPAGSSVLGRIDPFRAALPGQEMNPLGVGDQEQVLCQWIRIAVARRTHAARHVQVVRAAVGIDNRDVSRMFRPTVPWRKRRHDLARVRDRLGIDHHIARMLIAKIDHHVGPVGVDRPEVMVQELIAVDVLPAHVQHSAVGQHPGRVFLFRVVGQHADVGAVRVAAVQRGNLGLPARHEPVATAGTENDRVVGSVDGLDIVVRPVGQLPEIRAVDADFVQVVGRSPAPAIREQDFLAVVVDVRIADSALWIVQQHRQLAGFQVEAAESSAVAEGVFEVFDRVGRRGRRVVARVAVGVMSEIAVPVVVPRHALGKDDLLAANQRSSQNSITQLERLGGRCRLQARKQARDAGTGK